MKNVGKRIIKSPKIYFTDTGLASYFLRRSDPVVFENQEGLTGGEIKRAKTVSRNNSKNLTKEMKDLNLKNSVIVSLFQK